MNLLPIWFSLSCTSDTDTAGTEHHTQYQVVQATVSMDYAVGALATIDRQSNTLQESRSSISGDPVLDFDGEYLWQLNRYRYDTLRQYDPYNLSTPLNEISLRMDTDTSSNPQSAVRCAEKLFISQHDRPELLILDPTSLTTIGTISLQDFNDADGSPEAADLICLENQTLYVGLQRLNRNNSWISEGSVILQIDSLEEQIINHRFFGANIHLYTDSMNSLLVSSDPFDDQKGGIFSLDNNLVDERILEVEEKQILDLTRTQNHLYFITIDDDFGAQQIFCVPPNGEQLVALAQFDEFLTFIKSDADSVWIGAHWGWNNPADAIPGTHVWTVDGCDILEKNLISGALAPFDMVFIQ